MRAYRREWESRGLSIVAMQALLFGRLDLTLFDDASTRAATREYLTGIIRLGGQLGAKALVFGSPKNRKVGSLSRAVAEEIACEFFHALGEVALEHGTALCVEPNPAVYACDFITTAREGLELVHKVGSRGFCLHLDAGGITLSQEPIDDALKESMRVARHFHASEAQLAPWAPAPWPMSALPRHCARWGMTVGSPWRCAPSPRMPTSLSSAPRSRQPGMPTAIPPHLKPAGQLERTCCGAAGCCPAMPPGAFAHGRGRAARGDALQRLPTVMLNVIGPEVVGRRRPRETAAEAPWQTPTRR